MVSDMPRWTSYFRYCGPSASSSFSSSCVPFGDVGDLGPDPTALFYYFISKGSTNSYLEPSAWLIVLALVDKLYLEHFTLHNTLASLPQHLTSREAAIAAFGVRLYTGHTLRNLFVLFAMAHKWHGESYFTLKYFVDLLPAGLRKGSAVVVPSASSLVAAAAAGSHQAPLEPVELASIEEGFLRLLGYNLTIAPQSILRLADYFLSVDEKALIVDFVASNSLQKKFTVVM